MGISIFGCHQVLIQRGTKGWTKETFFCNLLSDKQLKTIASDCHPDNYEKATFARVAFFIFC